MSIVVLPSVYNNKDVVTQYCITTTKTQNTTTVGKKKTYKTSFILLIYMQVSCLEAVTAVSHGELKEK